MITVPAATPVTVPVEEEAVDTVAIAVLLDDQLVPPTDEVNVTL